MQITVEHLRQIYKFSREDKIKLYCEAFNRVFPRYSMNPRRVAAFLGQVAVESGELKYDKELPSKWNKKIPSDPNEPTGTLYEGRKALGNINPGDGPKFIGRGIIQITGRSNYTNMSRKIGYDLLDKPELACNPEIATRIACEYFKERGLFELADNWDIEEITKRVNGSAKLHLRERLEYSNAALKVLEKLQPQP